MILITVNGNNEAVGFAPVTADLIVELVRKGNGAQAKSHVNAQYEVSWQMGPMVGTLKAGESMQPQMGMSFVVEAIKPSVSQPSRSSGASRTGPGSLYSVSLTELQNMLFDLGYYEGFIDGKFGPATVQAVKGFQAFANLPASGHMDPTTMRALKARWLAWNASPKPWPFAKPKSKSSAPSSPSVSTLSVSGPIPTTVDEAWSFFGITKKRARKDDIKKLYRAFMATWHPDRNASKDAKLQSLRANAAWAILQKHCRW